MSEHFIPPSSTKPNALMVSDLIIGILEVAEDAIISIDRAQTIVLFNRGAEGIFGYQRQEVLGQPLDMLLPHGAIQSHRQHVRHFEATDVPSRHMAERQEVCGLRKDGSEFPAEVSISRVQHQGQTYFTAILRDVTQRKQAEKEIRQLNQELEQRVEERTAELRSMTQQLWQAAKLASVGELAASIAHELNNPLGTISLRIESILGLTPKSDPRRRLLEIVEQEVERMASLVANLLHFSRRGDEQFSTVNICEEIHKTLELTTHFLRRRNIQVQTDFAADVPILFADRQKLRQVFLNLFTNAGDAMPNGGMLIPRIRSLPSASGRKSVLIEIVDTGVGIASEILPNVMDPFFTTKEEGKGTGLGLAICRRIVQEHHGTIEIQSTPGKGTTVRIQLPVTSDMNLERLQKSDDTRTKS